MIEIRGVTVAFGRTVALSSLTLQIPPGITGVFGPNGAGKSTLLRAVAGLLRPTRGEITTHDRIARASDESYRRLIGYVGHSSGLYPDLTVRENLELFALLHGAPRDAVAATASALGIESLLEERAGHLSAGFKRRAAVARALVHSPEILLLDEPYANLDDDAAELMSAALRGWRGADRVALVATHGAKRVKSFADGSLILQRGRAVSHRVRIPDEAPA